MPARQRCVIPGGQFLSLFWQLEPQEVSRDAEDTCITDELAQFFGRLTFLYTAKLSLGKAEPVSNDLLRQWLAVVRMIPVGKDNASHMPCAQGVADVIGIPELRRYRRGAQQHVTRGMAARGTACTGVVASQPCRAADAVADLRRGHHRCSRYLFGDARNAFTCQSTDATRRW